MELQFHLLPIRDWNYHILKHGFFLKHCNFTYSLLGIETTYMIFTLFYCVGLQFHLLPIRDWNTITSGQLESVGEIAISLTPY